MVFPTPYRTWQLNNHTLYSAFQYEEPSLREVLESDISFFIKDANRILLHPDSIVPSALQIIHGGGLYFSLQAENLTLPEAMLPPSINVGNFKEILLETIVGEWSCSVNNSLGEDVAVTIIRICGKLFNIVCDDYVYSGMSCD